MTQKEAAQRRENLFRCAAFCCCRIGAAVRRFAFARPAIHGKAR